MVACLDRDMREFIAHMTQFVDYVDDAMVSPEMTDFDVLKTKIVQIREMVTGMESTIGISRKEPSGRKEHNASRTNDSQGKTPSRAAKPRNNDTKADRGKPSAHGKAR